MKKELTTRRKMTMRIAAWCTVILPSVAIGGCLLSHGHKEPMIASFKDNQSHNYHLCGAAPSELGEGLPAGTLGGGFPVIPPGPWYPGDEPPVNNGPIYEGPNLSNYHEQPGFVKDYFKYLMNNFPTNGQDGNCGYVGAAMLLSYYDTCWNSSFVPDIFNGDVVELDSIDDPFYESPGVKDYAQKVWIGNYAEGPMDEPDDEAPIEEKQAYENWTYGAFSLYIERMTGPAIKDCYIIPHLYTIAHQLGIIQFRGEAINGDYDWHKIMPLINLYDLGRVLNVYFAENGLSTGVEYKIKSLDDLQDYANDEERRNALRQEMIERLKRGQPLLVSGSLRNYDDPQNPKGDLHIALAYEYDETHDRIYGHTGWKGPARSRANFNSTFFEIDEYAYLNIKDTVRVTENNYRYRIGDTYLESFDFPSHIHNYDKAIDYGFVLKHALQCTCGDVHYELHTLGRVCNKCGHRK